MDSTVSALIIALITALMAAVAAVALQETLRCYRRRIKVTVETHNQTPTDRRIIVSVTNHGRAPVVLRSLTVHVPMQDMFPELDRDRKPNPTQRGGRARRIAGYVLRPLRRRDPVKRRNRIGREYAKALLVDYDPRHELMPEGTRQRIGPGEQYARKFPRAGDLPNAFGSRALTVIPSCRIVGRRERIWGPVSVISTNEGLHVSLKFDLPEVDP